MMSEPTSHALRQLANRLNGIVRSCLKASTTHSEQTAWPHLKQGSQTALVIQPMGCLTGPQSNRPRLSAPIIGAPLAFRGGPIQELWNGSGATKPRTMPPLAAMLTSLFHVKHAFPIRQAHRIVAFGTGVPSQAMPFNHNDHYHRLLLRQLPPGCRSALDVGCGTGRFARRGIQVDASDPSVEALQAARAISVPPVGPGGVRHRQAEVTTVELAGDHYDYICCLASIHHMPFGTVTALREALAPGGVLVILGVDRQSTPIDYAAWEQAAAICRGHARVHYRYKHREAGPNDLGQIRQEAAALLPRCVVRRRLFWRYLLVFRRDAHP